MTRILVVEDHENIRASVRSLLESEGYCVLVAADLQSARLCIAESPDLILLDWMLPDGQGIDFLKEIRLTHSTLPVIFLTARADTLDTVLGLELGANDYITKPFEPRELIARIRVRLRELSVPKKEASPDHCLNVGALTVDRMRHQVTFRGNKIDLVKKEYDLLLLFAENPERVYSRDEILNKVWGYDVFPTTRTIDTHVMILRQKLDEASIETVRSVGYRFKTL